MILWLVVWLVVLLVGWYRVDQYGPAVREPPPLGGRLRWWEPALVVGMPWLVVWLLGGFR